MLTVRRETVGAAESLTGGLVSAALTDAPGASQVFRGGLVVYATDLKQSLAGVSPDVLQAHGAVSAITAEELARGAQGRTGATYGVATTGVAGPQEQEGQPVGTVHVAVAGPRGVVSRSLRFAGGRAEVRGRAVAAALELLCTVLTDSGDQPIAAP